MATTGKKSINLTDGNKIIIDMVDDPGFIELSLKIGTNQPVTVAIKSVEVRKVLRHFQASAMFREEI